MESNKRRLECLGCGELMPALLLKYHEVVSNFDKIISVSNALFSICREAVSNVQCGTILFIGLKNSVRSRR
jgi:hypothetical protein